MSPPHSSPTAVPGPIYEYIAGRLYLGAYDKTPDERTPFLRPAPKVRSPSKRSSRAVAAAAAGKSDAPVYFTVDDKLTYNAFHHDFGPFHIGHLYRFAVSLHEVLALPENADRLICFWSHDDPKSRANAACILACYMVLIQNWPPHLALAPLAQMEPVMPFRDAGYSQADYVLNIQDVVYGVWKAKEKGLCALKDFSLEEYETFERVDMGDFNWISPEFLAFASPQHTPTTIIPRSSAEYARLPKTVAEIGLCKEIPGPFRNVLSHFTTRGIGLVVRLNSELYSPSYFTALGMTHLDMIFEDGTCPPLHLVRKFINLAHDTIVNKKKGIAVHCKAGLGRTGCLIGAYLIYKYAFTANEVIAYMRFMRPGMVVGPQQHWLHLNQHAFREWFFEDTYAPPTSAPTTPTKARPLLRQSASAKRPLAARDPDAQPHDELLPAPTPGQPRKASKVRAQLEEAKAHTDPDTPDSLEVHLARKRSPARASPARVSGRRAVSCTTTTTSVAYTVTAEVVAVGGGSDAENARPRTPGRVSGKGEIAVGKTRSPARRGEVKTPGVRKTSGRVGSIGSVKKV
ncbi:phosphatases II [Trichodelitschia bisporula]|uniref:protein-tyrosine-phosphatase n=1 Tax=Trichodelitschia bisporula TaxID=703511 RepID=A0A6G1HP82_9PEZI|nr:phosphatases II [Trichodelitschia bisporula]